MLLAMVRRYSACPAICDIVISSGFAFHFCVADQKNNFMLAKVGANTKWAKGKLMLAKERRARILPWLLALLGRYRGLAAGGARNTVVSSTFAFHSARMTGRRRGEKGANKMKR